MNDLYYKKIILRLLQTGLQTFFMNTENVDASLKDGNSKFSREEPLLFTSFPTIIPM